VRHLGAFYGAKRAIFGHKNLSHALSAMFASIFWKKANPPKKISTTIAADTANSAPGADPFPASDHRKPSITPAIGFNPYSQRHLAGTIVLE
jgi:hypothetical protein